MTPRAKILLVDDVAENLVALEAVLRTLDVDLVSARSGPEALEHLLVHDFALALLDVNMPEMDGFQLAELMRGTQRTRHVPIIFVTAANEPQRVFQGYGSGAVDFVIKPYEPQIMRSKVATFVELYQHKRQLADSLRLHETFVAALNHDLRNPLSTIALATTMLTSDLQDPKQKSVLTRLESATTRMTTILDQLYDLARTRLGEGIPLDRRQGDLATIVRDVVREGEIKKGERTLSFEVLGDARGTWDMTRLSRVAANLVANALTHGAKDGTIRVVVDGTQADRVRLTVRNQGSIPEETLPVIFEPFRRGANPSSSQGLGLGLYIVREITHAHGGEVTVTSTADTGTTFEVSLPRGSSTV